MVKSAKNTLKKKNTFYVTTAIDYPNAEPHIGHAYQKVIADILSRWNKFLGKEVYFLTGTDEHGKKIQETAEKSGKDPKKFVDELSVKFKEAWKSLDIEYDRFIRTTDKDHEKIVQEMIEKSKKNGDVYLGEYEGFYCVGCEAYYTEKELVDGKCPLHNRPLEKLKEESYFFKLSKYQKFLLDLYKKNPEFVLPAERRNEMISRVSEGLKDLSISRTSFDWGIPFPGNKDHVIYVWFDALFNYYTAVSKNEKFWPASAHLLGKDNGWFHCVYWPAFLKSVGLELPKTVFVHGFLTFNGQKISKSLGNAISPNVLVKKYGADTIRYYLARNFVFGQDGDFSEKHLVERYNNELANKYGNLVSRVSALAEKYGLEKGKNSLINKKQIDKIKKYYDTYEFDKALNELFALIDKCNEYIQNKKPWETGDKKILYELVDSIKIISLLFYPVIPGTVKKISKLFGFKISIDEIEMETSASKKIKKAPVLFEKVEFKEKENVNKEKIPGIVNMSEVEFSDWEKIKLVVGEIKKVEDIEGADKLYKISLDIGSDKERTVCAGIKKQYSKKELVGKKIILFENLKPRKLRGIESQGMMLAAVNKDESKVILISPSEDIEPGSIVR